MAQVDFSNAILDVNSGRKPLQNSNYLRLANNSDLFKRDGTRISNGNRSILSKTNNKVVMLYTGTFTASGTECCPGDVFFVITNVSFSSGDTYSFVIEVEFNVNT